MKMLELRDRNAADLEALEKDLSKQLWESKFSNYANQLDDTAKINRLRKDIARVKTLNSERKKAGA